ncbi:hypothetical protein MMC30_002374 [Trapelia coarctata]|nr:hypothetical protein [Trapelia coarctata]
METLRRLFVSSSISPTSPADDRTDGEKPASMTPPRMSTILELPNEIIHQILWHLEPLTLLKLRATCRSLQTHAENDLLWSKLVHDNLPVRQASPSPHKSWRELYKSYHPYWFLPRHKLWFADKATAGIGLAGQLIIARYDHRFGTIEAYRLVADFEHGQHTAHPWEWDSDVLIHNFTPRVRLFLDNPVIRLDRDSFSPGPRLLQEISMQSRGHQRAYGIRSGLFLTTSIPPESRDPTMSLWPPKIIPATNRVRNDSPSMFKGDGHKPQRLDQVCETAFRMRKWTEYRGLAIREPIRMGEDVLTFSTLPPECYTPTKDKPYQGIWVGDYAGHGCEFLLLLQTAATGGRSVLAENGQLIQTEVPLDETTVEDEDPPGCSGRLEAIKLTGDPNVPRGEYTWISDDIGKRGLIRIADEQIFKGSRIVRSWGHIAANGFRDDRYMESQLILISHDRLAQYWLDFGHIAFYSRVDIDDYLSTENA